MMDELPHVILTSADGEELWPPVRPADLDSLEARFGTPLPESFRRLYLTHDGGYPDPTRYLDEVVPWGLDGFLPLAHGVVPIPRLADDMAEINDALDGLLPFASGTGGVFLLSMRARDTGRLFVYLADGDELVDLEATFDDLIEMLSTRPGGTCA